MSPFSLHSPPAWKLFAGAWLLSIVSFTQFCSDTLQTVCGVHSDRKHYAFIKQLGESEYLPFLKANDGVRLYHMELHHHDTWDNMGLEVKTRDTWHEDAHAGQVHDPRQSPGCPGGLTLATYRKSGQRRLENTPRGDRHSWPGSSASAGVYSLHSSGWLIRQFWRQRSKVGGAGSWADTDAKWNWIGRK